MRMDAPCAIERLLAKERTLSAERYVDAVVTDAAIRNGYLDLEARHARFFPNDALGDRSRDHIGRPITIEFDGRSVDRSIPTFASRAKSRSAPVRDSGVGSSPYVPPPAM